MTLRAQVPGDDFGGEPPAAAVDDGELRWVRQMVEQARQERAADQCVDAASWLAARRAARPPR